MRRPFRPLSAGGALGVAGGALLLAVAVCGGAMFAYAFGSAPGHSNLLDEHVLQPFSIAFYTLFFAFLYAGVRVWKETPWREHLALRRVPAKKLAAWIAAYLALVAAAVALVAFGPLKAKILRDLLQVPNSFTPATLIVFLTRFVIITPTFYEILLRGLLFRAIETSRLGAAGAIIITSLLFAAGPIAGSPWLGLCFVGVGALLGVARWRTKSVITPWAMQVVTYAVGLVFVCAGLRIAG